MAVSFPGNRGNLYASVVIINIASVATGTHYTWSSPTIPKLQEAGSWLLIADEEASWLGSLTALGSVFGPFLGGWLVNRIGCRRAVVVSVLMTTIAWVILLFSRNVWEMYIGKTLGGVGGGVNFLACPLYVAEISEVAVRGALGSLFGVFLIGGYVLEYFVGPFVSYWTLIYINLIPAVIFFAMVALVPDSPYYFLRKGDEESGLKSLKWLRKSVKLEEVQKELMVTMEDIQRSSRNQTKLSDLVTVRGNRMGLFIACGIFTGQQISGVNTVLFYTQTIFIDSDSSISSSGSTIIVGSILLGGRLFSTPLIRAFGIKRVMICSVAGMGVFQFLLGLYSYYDDKGVDMSNYDWVPITTLMGYILFLTMGYGFLPWAVMAEVFAPNIKALASSVAASYNWIISFLLAKYFTDLNDAFGPHVAYFFFTAGSVFALVFTIVFLPDTRGMTLQEVTNMLSKQNTFHTQI